MGERRGERMGGRTEDAANRGFPGRMLGAVLCRATVFRELGERNPVGQAAIVVVLVSGVTTVQDFGLGWFPMFTTGAVNLLQWPVWAVIAYGVGRRRGDAAGAGAGDPERSSSSRWLTIGWGRLLGVLGFARTPGILVGFAPVIGGIQFAVHAWMLAAGVIGIREAMGIGTFRALLAALLGMIPYWIVLVLYLH